MLVTAPLGLSPPSKPWFGPAHKHLVKHDQEPWGVEGLHGPSLQRSWEKTGNHGCGWALTPGAWKGDF